MSRELHYNNSPLTEAVIDIHVTLPEDVTVDLLARVRSGDESTYPEMQKQYLGQVQVAIGDEWTTTGTGAQTAYFFRTSDERQIVQARLDGFAFIRRAPYENWTSFRDEARRWWDKYRSVANPQAVTRVAVRYINRLELPLPFSDFNEYLRVVPFIPDDLPQALNGFFFQVQMPQEDSPAILILNQTLAPPASPETASIILDIDLFQQENIPDNEDGLWNLFEWLRHRKNEVFEKSITDRMKGLIS
jgi:uncharacterized protein (TIGR04255 family)